MGLVVGVPRDVLAIGIVEVSGEDRRDVAGGVFRTDSMGKLEVLGFKGMLSASEGFVEIS